MRDLDAQIRRGDAKVIDDLGEIAGETDVGEEPAGQVPVCAHLQAASGRARRRRGGSPQHGEIHNWQDRRVRHHVDELLRLEEPAAVFPTRAPRTSSDPD